MLQLDIWELGFSYMAHDGTYRAFHANTIADACTYVQNYFRGRDTAYLYVWNRRNSSLDNFPLKEEEIKPGEILLFLREAQCVNGNDKSNYG